jgi:hypothetical protein
MFVKFHPTLFTTVQWKLNNLRKPSNTVNKLRSNDSPKFERKAKLSKSQQLNAGGKE